MYNSNWGKFALIRIGLNSTPKYPLTVAKHPLYCHLFSIKRYYMARKNELTDAVDFAIGARIKELRITMGLSRQQVSERIDVTHQQLQKYESGANRISIGRMVAIARALNKPICN